MSESVTDTKARDLLRRIAVFEDLAPDILDRIAANAVIAPVARGETLIQQGADADCLYIVLKGRFVVRVGDTTIAEIGPQAPIGELAFFAGGTRTASVIAARAGQVLCLTRQTYDMLARELPGLPDAILTALSKRLASAVSAQPQLAPSPARICAVRPAGDGKLPEAFIAGMHATFGQTPGWDVLTPEMCPAHMRNSPGDVQAWLEQREAQSDGLVLLCPDPLANPVWAEITSASADLVLDVVHRRGPLPARRAGSAIRTDLVLCRDEQADSTKGTAELLAPTAGAMHHHIALDTPADFARLARHIKGEALGLVMSGGGAFGAAHLGAVKALQEHGFQFDMFGGTSVGSAMAAAFAIGLTPDEALAQCEDIFIRSKAMARLTVPRYSVLEHHRLDEGLQRNYQGLDVEDTRYPFFATATSLSDNSLHILRTGPLWEAVRSSCSIPGIFPPFITQSGEVLTDGGLIDNLPIGPMRALKPGPNILLNFPAETGWRVPPVYPMLPRRLSAMASLLWPKRQMDFPSAMSVLTRAMVVNARKRLAETPLGDDPLITLNIKPGLSFTDWSRTRELFDGAYAQVSRTLETENAAPGSLADLKAAVRASGVRTR